MKNSDVQRMTLRLPQETYDRLILLQQSKPHLSLHAIIIEALHQQIRTEEREAEIRAGQSQLDVRGIDPDLVERGR